MFRNLRWRMCAWLKADKNRCIKYSAVFAVLILGIVLLVMDYRASVGDILDGLERNSYGLGTKVEELEVWIEGNEREALEIEVSERMYMEEEIDEMFQACISKIEKEMLGENETPDYVTEDLHLMTELPEEPVEIEWKLDCYDVMNIYGEIQEEEVTEGGTPVNLEAVITYTENPDRQFLYECAVMVYPKVLSEGERLVKKVKDAIQQENEETQTDEKLNLPESVDGKEVRYYEKMDNRGGILIVMAFLAGILFYAQEMQNQGQELRKKQQQMIADYPEIINKLTLFLGAGMTVKRAWRKVVLDYEAGKEIWGSRFAYEEMKIACREMDSGITEAESYERFGKRCNVQEYVRLGALLSQNMRKGTKGLGHILRLEAIQAFENRKAVAKKFGEEAGTRLLVPMFIMFTVVLVMVIVPAFLSMQV